jgi:hypothetical protein
MNRRMVNRALGMAVAVAVLLVFIAGSRDPSPDIPAPPGPEGVEPPAASDVIELLDGLRPGDPVGPGTVLAIDAPIDRIVWIDVLLGRFVFGIGVGATGTGGDKVMPLATDKYEIRYGMVRGEGQPDLQAIMGAAEAVAARVRRAEHVVALPAGM